MKAKILVITLALLFPCINYASQCDSSLITIENGSGHKFFIENITPMLGSEVDDLVKGAEIPANSQIDFHVSSGDGSSGDALGVIGLRNDEGDEITLAYKFVSRVFGYGECKVDLSKTYASPSNKHKFGVNIESINGYPAALEYIVVG